MFRSVRVELSLGGSVCVMIAAVGAASAQNAAPPAAPPGATPTQQTRSEPLPAAVPPPGAPLPQINVRAPKRAAARPARHAATPVTTAAPPPTPAQIQAEANREVVQRTLTLDQRRDNVILPKTGANTYELSQRDIENIPQANAIQLSDLMLQYPGVYQDSTSQGIFHVRNEDGNVQFRINGILLPDGVSGFSQMLESSFIGSMRLITGALPAQYGLHTAGIIDITTKSGAALAGGSAGVYGGSRQTISPNFEYGGVEGQTEYYVAGRYLSTGLGLQAPTPTLNGIHDYSQQGQLFGYTSTLLDPTSRIVTIAGVAESQYQIPNNVGQPLINDPVTGAFPGMTAFGKNTFDSANINQRQYEKNAYGVIAWQESEGDLDMQAAYYSRYNDLHFVPDPVGDMLFNGVASDVYRSTFLNGISGDVAYRLNEAHTIRGGFFTQGEQTQIKNISTVENLDQSGAPIDQPVNIPDGSNLFGWQLGAYVQDEWRLTDQLTFNYGLRFDQMFQYVDANQFSPRASFTYKPWWSTVFHVGYMRTFTPPPQVLGRPALSAPFVNTTNAPAVLNGDPILPERAHVVDAGIVQQLLPQCPTGAGGQPTKAPAAATSCPKLEVGASAYYKAARDLLDVGQFGQAYALTEFNYDKAENYGVELFGRFRWGNFTADTSWAWAVQHATHLVSNQTLFDPDDLAFIQAHWIHTEQDQAFTGSGRLSYRWTDTQSWLDGTAASATMIYGSGLRKDPAVGGPCPDCDHLPSYWQFNLGLSHEFADWGWNGQPVTVRFDVVNVADTVYQIRDGSGIGVFAAQYGPRRGYYMGISQKLGAPDRGPDRAPDHTEAAAAPAYHWAGPYVGANFGGVFNREDATTPIGVSATDPSGVLGGVQLGYNYQFSPWLLGIEAELDWTSAQGKTNLISSAAILNPASLSVTSDHNWCDTLSGRVGYVFGPLMLYAKGGAAWMNADYRHEVNSGQDGATVISANRAGWNVGAGLEYMLGSRWSAKLEYDYLDFGSSTLGLVTPFGNGVTFKTQINELKAGVNYHWAPASLFGVL